MLVELNHSELVTLIKGTYLPYALIETFKKFGLGSYNGNNDEWKWHYMSDWSVYSEDELYNMYTLIKNTK